MQPSTGPPRAAHVRKEDFIEKRRQSVALFSAGFFQRGTWAVFAYLLLVVVASLFALGFVLGQLVNTGIMLLATGPSIIIQLYLIQRFTNQFLPEQMFFVVCESTLWMFLLIVPNVLVMLAAKLLVRIFFPMTPPNEIEELLVGNVLWCILSPLIIGIVEESIKFLAVRRVLWKDHVCDPRALIVYGITSANTFAVLENWNYVIGTVASPTTPGLRLGPRWVSNGIWTAWQRLIVSVPGHCLDGSLQGSILAHYKFFNFLGWFGVWAAVLFPALSHWLFDFVATFIPLIHNHHVKQALRTLLRKQQPAGPTVSLKHRTDRVTNPSITFWDHREEHTVYITSSQDEKLLEGPMWLRQLVRYDMLFLIVIVVIQFIITRYLMLKLERIKHVNVRALRNADLVSAPDHIYSLRSVPCHVKWPEKNDRHEQFVQLADESSDEESGRQGAQQTYGTMLENSD
ncbi:unnamed protein product [Vitrella brassicaformis CCMP3155]|uniref:Uncharacterized protein n=1 Tax=Vitrella brassicaformis (strain CCMP3155) TaxID=1169540 RepID=A0A0G4FB34_VITBC|nr:unnamed protein product [Vitrella brassicaformis CCMP3155]|eukprot:CEM09853.1 unnamed protein product [Vitrella brassicaformis CCMP3155]